MLQGKDLGMVIGIRGDVIVREHGDTRGCQHTWTNRCSCGTLYKLHCHLHSIKRLCILRTRRNHVFLKIIPIKKRLFH
jgi:hypothetical protein